MDDALRPARHLAENMSKHPEKSGTSERKPALNTHSARYRQNTREKCENSSISQVRNALMPYCTICTDRGIRHRNQSLPSDP